MHTHARMRWIPPIGWTWRNTPFLLEEPPVGPRPTNRPFQTIDRARPSFSTKHHLPLRESSPLCALQIIAPNISTSSPLLTKLIPTKHAIHNPSPTFPHPPTSHEQSFIDLILPICTHPSSLHRLTIIGRGKQLPPSRRIILKGSKSRPAKSRKLPPEKWNGQKNALFRKDGPL